MRRSGRPIREASRGPDPGERFCTNGDQPGRPSGASCRDRGSIGIPPAGDVRGRQRKPPLPLITHAPSESSSVRLLCRMLDLGLQPGYAVSLGGALC
jgi:hypothetical protein